MASAGNDEQRQAEEARLWQHGLHEDTMLLQRGNLFLVAQSLLAVAYSTTAAAGDAKPAARVMAAFGIALTVIWVYAGHRHLRYSRALQRRAAERLPDFAQTQEACRLPGLSALPLIVYGLPALAAVMWMVLLFVT